MSLTRSMSVRIVWSVSTVSRLWLMAVIMLLSMDWKRAIAPRVIWPRVTNQAPRKSCTTTSRPWLRVLTVDDMMVYLKRPIRLWLYRAWYSYHML